MINKQIFEICGFKKKNNVLPLIYLENQKASFFTYVFFRSTSKTSNYFVNFFAMFLFFLSGKNTKLDEFFKCFFGIFYHVVFNFF